MRPWTFVPVEPMRWVHARRGKAYVTQHVVARNLSDPSRAERGLTVTLCARELGSMWTGPVTSRPLVTFRPTPDIPVCRWCAAKLRSRRARELTS